MWWMGLQSLAPKLESEKPPRKGGIFCAQPAVPSTTEVRKHLVDVAEDIGLYWR